MIKSIKGTIQRAKHFGAYGSEEFCLEVTVGVDAVEWNKLNRKKCNPIHGFIVQLKDIIYDATKICSIPQIGKAERAYQGIKLIRVSYYMHKDIASQLGANVSEWCVRHSIDLESHLKNNPKNQLFAKCALHKVINNQNLN